MKINKNIFIAFLSISIILFSFSNCYFISYATHGGGGGDNHGVLTSEEKKEMVKKRAMIARSLKNITPLREV